jgi:hypothetical protein
MITEEYIKKLYETIVFHHENGEFEKAEALLKSLEKFGKKENIFEKIVKQITGVKKKNGNLIVSYFIKTLKNPFSYKTTKIIKDKNVWTELNNIVYGENNWE